jgi:hypothetical protein
MNPTPTKPTRIIQDSPSFVLAFDFLFLSTSVFADVREDGAPQVFLAVDFHQAIWKEGELWAERQSLRVFARPTSEFH